MSRYNTIAPEPAPPAIDVDTRFTRLNMKADRATLEPGEYALLENGRTNRGVVETRLGTITPVFANVVDLSGGILGAAVYNNPNGLQTMLLALPDKVLQIRSGDYPREVAIPDFTTLAGTIEFVPEPTGHVIMFRGTDLAPLVWDGVSVTGFEVITKLDPSDRSKTLIPNGATGVAFNNRLLIPVDGTNIAVSDVGDYSSYDAILDDFKVAGTSDKITRLFPFRQSTLVIFKEQTVWLLSNFTNTTVSDGSGGTIVIPGPYNAQLELLSSTLGCIAPRGVTLVGGEPWFPDRTGLYALEEVFQENLKAAPVPLTDQIQPLWDRINWSVGDKIVAAVHGIRHYLAVPLDDSEVNNAVIVTNTVTRTQEAIDTWDADSGFQIDHFLVADYFGAQRLYAVNAEMNRVHLMYEGKHDEVGNASDAPDDDIYEIAFRFETRAYGPASAQGYGAAGRSDFKGVDIPVATWAPSIVVTELMDGALDERVLTPTAVTKDRTKYDIFAVPDFDPTNVNGDFDAPGRQDYSVAIDDSNEVDLEGVNVERVQRSVLRFSTKARGRYVSYRVECSQGYVAIEAMRMESGGTRTIRRAA